MSGSVWPLWIHDVQPLLQHQQSLSCCSERSGLGTCSLTQMDVLCSAELLTEPGVPAQQAAVMGDLPSVTSRGEISLEEALERDGAEGWLGERMWNKACLFELLLLKELPVWEMVSRWIGVHEVMHHVHGFHRLDWGTDQTCARCKECAVLIDAE